MNPWTKQLVTLDRTYTESVPNKHTDEAFDGLKDLATTMILCDADPLARIDSLLAGLQALRDGLTHEDPLAE